MGVRHDTFQLGFELRDAQLSRTEDDGQQRWLSELVVDRERQQYHGGWYAPGGTGYMEYAGFV